MKLIYNNSKIVDINSLQNAHAIEDAFDSKTKIEAEDMLMAITRKQMICSNGIDITFNCYFLDTRQDIFHIYNNNLNVLGNQESLWDIP